MPASRPTWLLESLEFQWPASPCPHSLPSLVFPFSHPPRHTCEWQIQGDLDPADHQGAKPGGSGDDQLGSGQPLDAFPGQWSGSWPAPRPRSLGSRARGVLSRTEPGQCPARSQCGVGVSKAWDGTWMPMSDCSSLGGHVSSCLSFLVYVKRGSRFSAHTVVENIPWVLARCVTRGQA